MTRSPRIIASHVHPRDFVFIPAGRDSSRQSLFARSPCAPFYAARFWDVGGAVAWLCVVLRSVGEDCVSLKCDVCGGVGGIVRRMVNFTYGSGCRSEGLSWRIFLSISLGVKQMRLIS